MLLGAPSNILWVLMLATVNCKPSGRGLGETPIVLKRNSWSWTSIRRHEAASLREISIKKNKLAGRIDPAANRKDRHLGVSSTPQRYFRSNLDAFIIAQSINTYNIIYIYIYIMIRLCSDKHVALAEQTIQADDTADHSNNSNTAFNRTQNGKTQWDSFHYDSRGEGTTWE